MTTVQNPTKIPKQVDVVLANGTRDQVFVQPMSKVTLPAGVSVATSYSERDKSIVVKS
jgi:hypothetical protein